MMFMMVFGCWKYLNAVVETYNVYIIWVPGHNTIQGNCRLDELARSSRTIEPSDEFFSTGVPLRTCELLIDEACSMRLLES